MLEQGTKKKKIVCVHAIRRLDDFNIGKKNPPPFDMTIFFLNFYKVKVKGNVYKNRKMVGMAW